MSILWLDGPSGSRRSKYGAVPTVVDGLRFASRREARRWAELQRLLAAGEIKNLARQVIYPLLTSGPNGASQIVGHYVADFTYWRTSGEDNCQDERVVEDAKGVRTALYRWKARHFRAQYGYAITEV